jgi:aminopeptidase N
VNKEGSGDMYFKGANLLHTVREVINDDVKFREILRGLNADFYHQTVTSKQVEDYISQKSGKDLQKIFDQYLRTIQIPVLEYKIKNGVVQVRWTNCVNGFAMPVKVFLGRADKNFTWISPVKDRWITVTTGKGYDGKTFEAAPNFYIEVKKQ